jgi:glyoxylase-like metal-dependent hydrolase (beta-lactamase superfamily II)
MTLPSAIQAVVIEAQMPPGVLGPDPVTLDVRCFVVPASNGVMLVDAGLPGSSPAIEATLERIGAAWSDITDIVLTHAHFDHVGGLADVAARTPKATLSAGALDVAMIPVDGHILVKRLGEGDRVGGLLVLDTPGHTPGHISLMDETRSLVIVGDLVGSVDGALSFGPPAFTADAVRSRASLERVARMGVGRLLFGHGPEVPDSSDLALELLAASE